MVRRCLVLLVLVCLPVAAAADEVRAWVWGTPQIRHESGRPELSALHWLARLVEAGGHRFAADGRGDDLRGHFVALPPEREWRMPTVPPAWRGEVGFRMANFDAFVIAPPPALSSAAPGAPYEDAIRRQSPLSVTATLIDWAANQSPGARVLIWEGWPELAPWPPRPAEWAGWRERALGASHDWVRALVEGLREEHPDLSIAAVPVASVLERLLAETALDLPPEALFTDALPRGTETAYLLAALVAYSVIYAEPPPEIALPETIRPEVRDGYRDIAAFLFAAASGAPVPERAAAAAEPVADPALGMGLDAVVDWSPQLPFIDLMKGARPWTGHVGDAWGGWDVARLAEGGYLDAEGWPVALPEEVRRLDTLVLTDMPPGAVSLAGRYVVRWEGQGRLAIDGIARNVRMGAGEARFDYRPGPGAVMVGILETDPDDPIRDIRIVRQDLLPLHEMGAVFDPGWLARIADFRVLRFMDWMQTNGSRQVAWDDRPRPGDFTYGWRGVPVEVMVRLANEVGADPWFTLPHMADDDYVRRFAEVVRDGLDPRLKAHAEWSNEVWNFRFDQAHWAREQALARWGEAAGEDAWMQFAGARAAEVADIWAEVFGAEAGDRLVRVIATHTGWRGLEASLLSAPLLIEEGGAPPFESFDAYAVTGYFGYELGSEEMAAAVAGWAGAEDGFAQAAEAIREGSLRELTEELWPHHARIAESLGLRLVVYEGGTHVVAQGGRIEDETATDFFTAFNYSPEVAALYDDLFAAWKEVGGTLFTGFVDIGKPSKWGSWGTLRHRDDLNPRWTAVAAANATLPTGWEDRAEGTFAQGEVVHGGPGPEVLEGTAEEDVILASGGDDVVRGTPGDRIDGGAGLDVVRLPGTAEAWVFTAEGALVRAAGPGGDLWLRGVERAAFDGGGTVAIAETEALR